MGTDIELYVEKQDDQGKWKMIDNISVLDIGRNYNLFAILANMRNGFGFAGIKTGNGFIPITKPKGIPEDASAEYLKIAEENSYDGENFSYHTIQDLLDHDWNQRTQVCGDIDLKTYKKWMENEKSGEPDDWTRLYGGASLSNSEMEELINSGVNDNSTDQYTSVKWTKTYRECVGEYFFDTILDKLKKIAEDHSKVRIVFFFLS